MLTALSIFIWMSLRTLKYEFTENEYILRRYLWYRYYVPQTFCVLFRFLAVLHIGRSHECPIHVRWKLLYIPAAVIAIGKSQRTYLKRI